MTEMRFLPEDLVNGAECFHIIGNGQHSDDTKVWIEKNTFFVRRLEEKTITTVEDCSRMLEETQSEQHKKLMIKEMKKAGLSSDLIEFTLTELAKGFQPSTSCDIYNYQIINVNQPIDDALFTA